MTVLSVENIRVNIKVKNGTVWVTTNLKMPDIVTDESIYRYGRYDNGFDVFVIHNHRGCMKFEIKGGELQYKFKPELSFRANVLNQVSASLKHYLCYAFIYRIHYHKAIDWTKEKHQARIQKHFDEGLEHPTPLDYIHKKFPERLPELRALEKSHRDLLTSINRLCEKLKGKP